MRVLLEARTARRTSPGGLLIAHEPDVYNDPYLKIEMSRNL